VDDIRVWEAATGRELRRFQMPEGQRRVYVCSALSPDGRTLATGCSDCITLWEVATGKVIRQLKPSVRVICFHSLAFAPDGKTLAAGSWDHVIRLWDVATGQELRQFLGHENCVNALAFSPDGATLASANGLTSRGDKAKDF